MNRLKYIFSTVFLVSVLFVMGCGDDNPTDPNLGLGGGNGTNNASGSFTINGDGYSNATFGFSYGGGAWIQDQNYSGVALLGKAGNDSMLVTITFTGTATGEYNWEGMNEDSTDFNGLAIQTFDGSQLKAVYAPVSGKTVITAYGNVGQNIEGSVNGTVVNAMTQQSATVTGTFKVIRFEDQDED